MVGVRVRDRVKVAYCKGAGTSKVHASTNIERGRHGVNPLLHCTKYEEKNMTYRMNTLSSISIAVVPVLSVELQRSTSS